MENFLTVVEVAKCLGVPIPEAEKVLRRSGLRTTLVAGQRRYQRDDLIGWLENEFGSFTVERLRNMDLSNASNAGLDPSLPFITMLLEQGNIHSSVPARTRSSMLRSLAALACGTGLTWDDTALLEQLQEREEIVSTALPNGVAFPHPRDIRRIYVEGDVLLLARPSAPVAFGAPSGRLTSLFFLLLLPSPSVHLHVLARLNRMIRDERTVEALVQADTAKDMLEIVRTAETGLVSALGAGRS
jgi:mannitol/fructose-specific phosphotransferase system IIA component (Ntr-type)